MRDAENMHPISPQVQVCRPCQSDKNVREGEMLDA